MRITSLIVTLLLLAGCNAAQNGSEPAGSTAAKAEASTNGTDAASADETTDRPPANETQTGSDTSGEDSARETEDSAPPETDYEPAFPGQTRAPKPAATEDWATETLAGGLEHPWAIEFLPDGSMLVTERPGRLRHMSADGVVSDPLAGVPEVDARNQGGLLDIAIAPDFESSRTIFFTFSEPHDGGTNNTAVARARLSDDHRAIENVEVIFSQYPSVGSTGHYGSRIVFESENTIWVSLGDRQGDPVRKNAQDPTNTIGAVVRIHTDGGIPQDNPFVDHAENAPEIWSYGHRNVQAAAKHPETGELWIVEHGPRGGDELNQPRAGRNYGWPTISYGIEYRGGAVYDGMTEAEGMEQPIYYWDPVIAPSGMTIYTGEAFPAWQGDVFVGGLRTQRLSRLVIEEGRVVGEEWLEIGHRVRDVVEGPDGALYLVTDEPDGRVMRVMPAES